MKQKTIPRIPKPPIVVSSGLEGGAMERTMRKQEPSSPITISDQRKMIMFFLLEISLYRREGYSFFSDQGCSSVTPNISLSWYSVWASCTNLVHFTSSAEA
jgi:hypothetical protein